MRDFMKIKNEFLDDYLHGNENLRDVYVNAYKKNIEPYEIELDKDLKEFDKELLAEITGRKTRSTTRKYKNVTQTFVFEYLFWIKNKEKEEEKQRKIKLKEQERTKKEMLKIEKSKKMEKYIKQKEVFMYEYFPNASFITKNTYMDCYKSQIAPLEAFKGKDLKDFNEMDIQEIFESMGTTSLNVKRMVYGYIESYYYWIDSKGMNLTNHNPLKSLDKDELFTLNIKAFKKDYPSQAEVYETCNRALKKGSNYQDCILVLIPRILGIEGKFLSDLLNLRWENINFITRKVKFADSETGELREFDIDENLLPWLIEARDCNIYNYKKIKDNEDYFYDNGYVIKAQSEEDLQETRDNVYRRLRIFAKMCSIKPYSIRNLVTAREFDDLDVIRAEKGELVAQDVIEVHKKYFPNASPSAYWFVSEKYELYNDVEIKSK